MNVLPVSSELILGGQKSGKSRRAEQLAKAWLAQGDQHSAVLLATAQPWDDEMRQRIERHQHDRALRVPGLHTQEVPLELAHALQQASQPQTLVIVDCLTLWLTNWTMPVDAGQGEVSPLNLKSKQAAAHDWLAQSAHFFDVLAKASGPVVLVGNEIGMGVIPLGREVRSFVDALGMLNQRAAEACARVTLMVAGLPMSLKETP